VTVYRQPVVVLDEALCAALRLPLIDALARAIRLGEDVPERVRETIAAIGEIGEAFVAAQVTPELREVDKGGCDTFECSVKEAAEFLACSGVNVRRRCASGSLVGRKVGGEWLVDKRSLKRKRSPRLPQRSA